MNLYNIIEDMQEDIAGNISDLNRGGCIVFAYYFANVLRDIGVPYEIYFCKDYYKIPNSVNAFDGAPHVVVKVKDYYVDGYESFFEEDLLEEYQLIKVRINVGKIVDKPGCWNNTYDRSQNSKLKTIIKKHLYGYRRRRL